MTPNATQSPPPRGLRLTPTDTVFVLAWVFLLGLPVALVVMMTQGGFGPEAARATFPGLAIAVDAPARLFWIAALIGLMPWALGAWCLWEVQRLMQHYRTGAALSLAAAHKLQRIGKILLLLAVTQVLARSLQVLVLTAANPAGERVFSVTFGTPDLCFALAAWLLFVIGQAMVGAARAVEEMRGFV